MSRFAQEHPDDFEERFERWIDSGDELRDQTKRDTFAERAHDYADTEDDE